MMAKDPSHVALPDWLGRLGITSGITERLIAESAEVFLSIVMPTYNEGRTIVSAVNHVLSTSFPCQIELIVVDDGSSDDTLEKLNALSRDRLRVIRHPRNLGKGAALLTGISMARGTYMVPFDADLEYSAADIARMVQPVIDGKVTLVYGVRLFGVNTVYQSFRYKLGNKFTTLMANILFDSAITDMHTCLKLVPLRLLRQMRLTERGFGMDTEITANLLKLGYRPFELPVSYYARTRIEGKKINWLDGIHCLRVLAKVRMARRMRSAIELDQPSLVMEETPAVPSLVMEQTSVAEAVGSAPSRMVDTQGLPVVAEG